MRPVAAPQQALRGELHVLARDPRDVGVARRSDLGVEVGSGELQPGAPGLQQARDDAERRVARAIGLRHAPQVVEHDRDGQPLDHRRELHDLLAAQVQLHMPAHPGHAPGEGFDHVHGGHGGLGVMQREAQPADAARVHRCELVIPHRGMHHRHAARAFQAQLRHRVHRHPVVGTVGRGLDHDRARGPQPLLQQPVFRHRGVGSGAQLRPRHREARVVDVQVAIAGAGGRLEAWRGGPGAVGDFDHRGAS